MTIEDSLILLNNTKQSIKTAIENKGVTVGAAPFADYAGLIDAIPALSDLPEIGDSFGGGYFAGLMFLDDGIYANIISPASTGETQNIMFKNDNTDDPGADNRVDTRPNMAIIDDADHPAAQFCTGLTIGGKTDWVLPSPLQILNAVSELSQRNLMAPGNEAGILVSTPYWSSAQLDFDGAFFLTIQSNLVRSPTLGAIMKNTGSGFNARAFRLEKLD